MLLCLHLRCCVTATAPNWPHRSRAHLGGHTMPSQKLDTVIMVHEQVCIFFSPEVALCQVQSLSVNVHSIHSGLRKVPVYCHGQGTASSTYSAYIQDTGGRAKWAEGGAGGRGTMRERGWRNGDTGVAAGGGEGRGFRRGPLGGGGVSGRQEGALDAGSKTVTGEGEGRRAETGRQAAHVKVGLKERLAGEWVHQYVCCHFYLEKTEPHRHGRRGHLA